MRPWMTLALFPAHMTLNTFSNASLKQSASGGGVRGYMSWQLVGNTMGFFSVQALNGLFALLPMHAACPISQGLAVIGTQVVAARW